MMRIKTKFNQLNSSEIRSIKGGKKKRKFKTKKKDLYVGDFTGPELSSNLNHCPPPEPDEIGFNAISVF